MSSPYYDGHIHTNAQGVPFERPERPRVGSSIEELTAFMYAVHQYDNAVRSYASQQFAVAFAKAMKEPES